MKDRRLICYVSMGMGDFYNMITMIPDIAKKRNISKENIIAYIDSKYFYDDLYRQDLGFPQKRESAEKIMGSVMDKKNMHVIPKELRTVGMLWKDKKEWYTGARYEWIKNDFLYYRRPETKNYMKSKIREGDIFIYSHMGEFNYEWRDGTNVLLKYERKPLKFSITKEQKEKLDNAISGKSLLIHVRRKNDLFDSKYHNTIIEHCKDKGIKCILIGLKNDFFGRFPENININNYENIVDFRSKISFEENMHLVENAKHMLTSTSMFTNHRLFFNKPTIICSSEKYGSSKVTYSKEQLDNENYLFLYPNNPIIDVIEEIEGWKFK